MPIPRYGMAVVALCAMLGALPLLAGAAGDKLLQHQRGTVEYRDPSGATHVVSAQQIVNDKDTAITLARSMGLLTLPDSSEVTLGENTSVQLDAFNDATSTGGASASITVNHGAVRFAVRHPRGGKANYVFHGGTSQIAVRGTEGYIVVGDRGTQVVCTKCEPGDVTITVAGVITTLVTGQVFTSLNGAAAGAGSVSTTSSLNNPAVNQFTGSNPFGANVAASDVTGSASGSAAAAGAGVSAGAVAAGTVAAGGAVAAASNNNSSPQATPQPGNLVITPSSLVVQSGSQSSLPIPMGAMVTSSNPSVVSVLTAGPTLLLQAHNGGTAIVELRGPSGILRINVTVIALPGSTRPTP